MNIVKIKKIAQLSSIHWFGHVFFLWFYVLTVPLGFEWGFLNGNFIVFQGVIYVMFTAPLTVLYLGVKNGT